jgi:hypothetical protein
VVRSETRYFRIGQRYIKTIVRWFIVFTLILFGYFFVTNYLFHDIGHYGVIEIGNPILVYWWNNDEKQFSLIKIPADAYSISNEIYHQYTLKSLWKLGLLDNRNRLILNQNISLVLNLPIKWYVSSQGIDQIGPPESTQNFTQIFRARQTNMPFQLYISYLYHKLFSDKSTISTYDFTQTDFLRHETLADSRDALYLDSDKIDSALSHNFELESIRRENLKIAILNVTDVSGLGDKISKIFNRLGIYVGTVSNVSSTIESCKMIGKAAVLKTQTARIIQNIFQCSQEVRRDDKPYDLEVLIGNAIFPFQK